ncbi:MAG: hypothetical protein ACE5JS_19470 [Nitrospinota bacterium]
MNLCLRSLSSLLSFLLIVLMSFLLVVLTASQAVPQSSPAQDPRQLTGFDLAAVDAPETSPASQPILEKPGQREGIAPDITFQTCGDHTVALNWHVSQDYKDRYGVTLLILDPEYNVRFTLRNDGDYLRKRNIQILCIDLNRDGKTELILRHYSGGAHCCNTLSISTLGDKIKNILVFFAGNGALASFEDLDYDNIKELIVNYDGFAYFGGLCFACSPILPLVLCYRSGRYQDCTKKFPTIVKTDQASYRARVGDEPGYALGFLAASILLDEEKEAWDYLRAKLNPTEGKIDSDHQSIYQWLEEHRSEIRKVVKDRKSRIVTRGGTTIPNWWMYPPAQQMARAYAERVIERMRIIKNRSAVQPPEGE